MVDKELFLKFEDIRKSGKYNMFTEGFEVMTELGLNPQLAYERDIYLKLMRDYRVLAKKWL